MPLVRAGDQVPPVSGVPPKLTNKSCDASVLQIIKVALVPTLGSALTVTDTVAVASPQGGIPVMVYV